MARVSAGMWVLAALAGCWPRTASAQPRPDPGRELELIESTESSEDPLGIDDSTGAELDRAAARLKKPVAKVFLPTPDRGVALSAIDGVRESAHRMEVQLRQGLAFVSARISLSSHAKHRAEVAYRLPLPEVAAVTGIKVCKAKHCRDASPSAATNALYLQALARTEGSEPGLWAEPIADTEGPALALRVAPLLPGESLDLVVDYVAEAPLHGGRARFQLPARGYDPNLAPAAVRVGAPELSALSPAAEFELEPWGSVELSATLPSTRARLSSQTSTRCGPSTCERHYEATPLAAPELRPTWLLIDASPSMEGPARGRASTTVAALLSALPDATDLRALAFAARAVELGRFQAAAAPLVELADAPLRELDAATHLAAALDPWQREIARAKPRIVVLSDGLFDPIASEREALQHARRQGAELVLLAVGMDEPRFRELFHVVLNVGKLADRALRLADLEPLIDALRVLASPVREGIRAGAQQVHERAPKKPWPVTTHGHWLTYWLARSRPTAWSLVEPATTGPVILAIPYTTMTKAAANPASTGMPAESVLSMLRTQLVPQARACLRSDRKGRGDYAVGLTFHALFAEREAYESRVEGNITPALRSCLTALVPKLRVPAFSGRIRVKYPIHTEREAEAPVIELEPTVSQTLERAFGPAHALP